MLRRMCEIFVRREQYDIVPNAKLRKQGIDGTELDSCAAASVAQGGRVDVIIPIGLEERQCCEALNNLGLRLGTKEALQKLLQDQSSGHNDV
jgi:hypothetical protein